MISFPIGNIQQIEIGSLTLTLNRENFIADSNSGQFGYTRDYEPSSIAEAEQLLLGHTALKSNTSWIPYEFSWSLLLDRDKYFTLKAIIEEQQNRIVANNANCGVIVRDGRFSMIEVAPQNRLSWSPVSQPITSADYPPGFVGYWPVFSVLLRPTKNWATLWGYTSPTTPYISVELTAIELNILPP